MDRARDGKGSEVVGFIEEYGLVVLFGVLALQAAGVPGPPGKTTLVAAAILAARGHLPIVEVIVVAAVGIVIGGFVGYAIGRFGGRRVCEHRLVACRLERPLGLADRFFDRHGTKAVFLARFFPGVKVVAALAAGIARMPPAAFALWHTLAAISFAAGFGLLAYYAGEGAIELAESFGLYGVVLFAALAGLATLGWLFLRRRARAATT